MCCGDWYRTVILQMLGSAAWLESVDSMDMTATDLLVAARQRS